MLLTVAAVAAASRVATTSSILTRRWAPLGVLARELAGIPHLYDMHSSLPQQLCNFRYSQSPRAAQVVPWAEDDGPGSDVVITICQDLQDTSTAMGVGDRALLIENVMGGDVEDPPTLIAGRSPAALGDRPGVAARALHGNVRGVSGHRPALRGDGDRRETHPAARLLVAAARPDQIEPASASRNARARRMWCSPAINPPVNSRRSSHAADILRPPRIRGTNTPLKIYSYLRSGKPIVATNLLTHTQVLTPEWRCWSRPTRRHSRRDRPG